MQSVLNAFGQQASPAFQVIQNSESFCDAIASNDLKLQKG